MRRALVTILLVSSVLAACGAPPKAPPPPGIIGGTLAVDGGDLTGAVVSIPGTLLAPDAGGHFQFSVVAGTYVVSASKAGYVTASQSVTVAAGKTVTVSLTLKKENHAPVLASFSANPSVLARGGTADLLAVATDDDGDALTYTFTAADDAWTLEPGASAGTATVQAPDTPNASTTVRVTVDDGKGGTATGSILLSTSANQAPLIAQVQAVPSAVAPGGTVAAQVEAADPDGDALTYAWSAPDGWTIAGSGASVTVTAPNAYGQTATLTVVVADPLGATATGTATLSTTGNDAPTISSLTALPNPLAPGGTATLAVTATDPDGDDLAYSWSAPDGWTVVGSGPSVQVTAPETYGQTATVSVTVDDQHGKTTSAQAVLETTANQPPIVSSLTATPPQVAPGGTATLEVSAADPDGDPLTYAWSAPDGWTLDGAGAKVTLTAPATFGTVGQVTVTVTDAGGASVSSKVVVSTETDGGPVVQSITATPPQTTKGGAIALAVTATSRENLPLTYAWTAPDGWTLAGTGADVTLTAPDQYGATGTVSVAVSDGELSASTSIVVGTVADRAPIIDSMTAQPPTVFRGQTSTVSVDASDPDGDVLTYAWTAPDGWTLAGTGADVTVTAPNDYDQTGTIMVTVSDGYGQTARGQVVLSTAANRDPIVQSLTATPVTVAPDGTVDVKAAATDPDGDDLAYAWTAPSGWTLTGTGAEVTLTAPAAYSQTGVVAVVVSDGHGGEATARTTVATSPNHAPVISSIVASPPAVEKGGTVKVDVLASDPDGDALAYAWTAPSGWTMTTSGAEAQLMAPSTPDVHGLVVVKVDDGHGGTAAGQVSVATLANQSPIIASLTATPPSVEKGGTIDLAAAASDPDGDALTYSWTPPAGWTLAGTGASVTVTAPDSYSASGEVQLTVSDGFGGTATSAIVVSTLANRPPQLSSLTATPPSVEKGGTIDLAAAASDADGDTLTYAWTVPAGWTLAGSGASVTVTAPSTYAAKGKAQLVVTDGYGGNVSGAVDMATNPDQAPVLSTITASPASVFRGGTIAVTATASDPDGDVLTYAWNPPAGWTISGAGSSITVTAPNSYGQSATLALTVSDGHLTAQGTVGLETQADRPPVFTSDPSSFRPTGGRVAQPYTAVAVDPDGDPVSYSLASGAPAGTSIGATSGVLAWHPTRAQEGPYSLDIDASDGILTAQQTISGTVGPFSMRAVGYAGNCENGLAVADFNGDGWPDVATFDSCNYQLRVRLNDGAGGLGDATTYGVGGAGNVCDQQVSAVDLNGDGHPDVVMNDSCGNRLLVFLNDGNGGFGAPLVLSSSVSCLQSFAVGNYSSGGHTDLLAFGACSNSLQLFTGDGSGNFTAQTAFPTGGSCGNAIVDAGDVNHDGHADIAWSDGCNNLVHVLLGDGSGGFSAGSTVSTGRCAGSLGFGDLDANGTQDMVVYAGCDRTLSTFLNDGSGNFTAKTSAAVPGSVGWMSSIVFGDFDGDGRLDVATSDQNQFEAAMVFFGDGTGHIDDGIELASPSPNDSTQSIAATDIDKDGQLDLVGDGWQGVTVLY